MDPRHFVCKDLLGIKDLSKKEIEYILYIAAGIDLYKKFCRNEEIVLKGKTVINLFFEPSTRTRSSFEIAAKRLGANVINFYPEASSISKKETLLDTIKTFGAMNPDAVIIRHKNGGVPKKAAEVLDIPVINAGDGINEHPSQALLDLYTVQQKKGTIAGLNVAVVGDISHSRVARSNIYGFLKMGANVRIAAPPGMLPEDTSLVRVCPTLDEALDQADVVMALRIQFERFGATDEFPDIQRDYIPSFGLNCDNIRRAKEDVILMHPGPVNRNVEVSGELIDSHFSVVSDQVRNGVLVRMAILYLLLTGNFLGI